MTYTYARLSSPDFWCFRLLGNGLGNLLFPWARSVVAAKRQNWTPIFPTWPQLKIGPLLRRERDKRFYNGLFKPTGLYAARGDKFLALAVGRRVTEGSVKEASLAWNARPSIVMFTGMKGYFGDILCDYDTVRRELVAMTREEHKNGYQEIPAESICVHVRMGDFQEPEAKEQLSSGAVNYRIPINWYRKKLEQIVDLVGEKVPIFVFSDGEDDALAPILDFSNAERAYFGTSIADMLALSRAGVLLASGSTFSMWASYLGRMPVVWYPGQRRQSLYKDRPQLEAECGTDEALPSPFAHAVVDRIRGKVD